MLPIHKTIIFLLLLSCAWAIEESDELDDEEYDYEVLKNNQTHQALQSALTEKSTFEAADELGNDRSLNPSPEPFDLSKILHVEEKPNPGCGFVNPQQANEFPWIIRINSNNKFIGSGSLIAPDIVLTTASLFEDIANDSLTVVAGEWALNNEQEMYPHLIRTVKKVIQHSRFNGHLNNIALLVLRSSFSRQPNIQSICLPTPATVVDEERCLSIGWTDTSSMPRQNRFAMQSSDVCIQRIPQPYVQYKKLNPSAICGTLLNDSAYLNAGAALFCPMKGISNRYTQTGIVIGSLNRTGVMTGLFVNMNHFMPWIYLQLGPRDTDLRHYLPFV